MKKGGCKAALEFTLIPPGPIQESSQSAAPAGVAQLAKRLCFDLADTFACDGEVLTDLLEGVLGPIFQPKPHLDHSLFAWCQCVQHLFGHFLEVYVDDRIRR
jgi:hypothetical protein